MMPQRTLPNEAALRKALDETLSIFGPVFKNAILHDLNMANSSRGPEHLDMGMISDIMKRHFGPEGCELIMHRLLARVQKLEKGKKRNV